MNPIPRKEAPISVNGTVRSASPPKRVPNRDRRSREHLTEGEVDELMRAAKARGRYGHRDATMILLAYRHGLRVSELVALRWDQVDLREGRLQVNRVKRGTASVHFLLDPKLRALRKLEREERKRTSLAVWTCRLSLSKRSNRTMTAVRGDRLKTQVGVVTYFLAGRRSTVGVMSRGSSGRSKCGETFHRCPASVSTLTVFRL